MNKQFSYLNSDKPDKEKVICNKMDERYKKCCDCPHGKPHFPKVPCNIKETKCSRNIEDTYGVMTKCLP